MSLSSFIPMDIHGVLIPVIKRLAIVVTISQALSACQSEADRIAFPENGTVFTRGDSLCFGSSGKTDVLSYYYLEEVKQYVNNPLLNSGDEALSLTYPDTCFNVKFKPETRYGALYIMNNLKYSYEFKTNENGMIM